MQRFDRERRRQDVSVSFEDLVAAEYPGLLRYAGALTGHSDQAADIVQDVLARAWTRWDRVQAADQPAAYLVRMVTNEFLSWRRRWNTRSVVPVDGDDLERASGATRDHGEDIVERHDLERRLAALPRRQQAALVLRFYGGLDYAGVAHALDCAEGTARSLCSRGLAALRIDDADSVVEAEVGARLVATTPREETP